MGAGYPTLCAITGPLCHLRECTCAPAVTFMLQAIVYDFVELDDGSSIGFFATEVKLSDDDLVSTVPYGRAGNLRRFWLFRACSG